MEACFKMLMMTTRILACGTERLVLPFTNREDMKNKGCGGEKLRGQEGVMKGGGERLKWER